MTDKSVLLRLKECIEKSGLSYVELEKKTGIAKSSLQRYVNGTTKKIPFEAIQSIASAVGSSPEYILGWNQKSDRLDEGVFTIYPDFVPGKKYISDLPSNIISINVLIPVYGSIPAGEPAFAEQNVIDYVPIFNKNPNDYFGLKVRGQSMIGARILDGSTVIIQRQPCAEDGDIVACRLNGDEATLKRFKRQGNTILLLPENPEFEPRIVPAEAFENGEAEILGVVRQILIDI